LELLRLRQGQKKIVWHTEDRIFGIAFLLFPPVFTPTLRKSKFSRYLIIGDDLANSPPEGIIMIGERNLRRLNLRSLTLSTSSTFVSSGAETYSGAARDIVYSGRQ
jgi:hypothetical protein